MNRKLVLIVVLITAVLVGKGQDSHLSMYYAAPNLLNPAMTGRHVDSYYRAHLQYRNQWYTVTNNPFLTMAGSFDKSYRKFGFGAYIKNTRAGIGAYNVMNVLLSGAYEITNDPLRIHHLSAGIQLGFIQKSVKSSYYTFDSQYSKDYGAGDFDPNLPTNELFGTESILLPELNFGLYYYRSDNKSLFNPYGGLSAFHLTTPEETFLGSKNNLPMRFVGYGGSSVQLNWLYRLDANVLIMREGNVNEFAGGFLVYYEPEQEDMGFFIGPYYRHKDAIQIHTGIEYGEFTFRVAYDITSSKLGDINKRQGGLEVGITYSKHKGKYIPSIL